MASIFISRAVLVFPLSRAVAMHSSSDAEPFLSRAVSNPEPFLTRAVQALLS